MSSRFLRGAAVAVLALLFVPAAAGAKTEARIRWERMCQIRADKFDLILPEAMRGNGIDMWITVMKEGYRDPLWPDLGHGYVGSTGYVVFTDRGGDRIERVSMGVTGYKIANCGVYDQVTGSADLAAFVRERDPERIGVNMSRSIGAADGLSHTSWLHLRETLGEPYADRLVSAEKLISDFRSRRVASEIVAFGEAGEWSRKIAERAFSNEVITPGVTALEDVGWWIEQQLLENGLDSSFGMPSIYITGPAGIEATSNERIIQRGDLLMIDWGVGYLNFYTDMKRIAYVLKEGEIATPPGIQNAFDRGRAARDVIRRTIKPGPTAGAMLEQLGAELTAAGFQMIEFNQPTDDDTTDVVIGCHSVGNLGHGIGPSIAWFNPTRLEYEIVPSNMFSIELFAYTKADEFGGAKIRIPLEDDAIVTERGVEWFYPANDRILLIR
ncbi:MAG: M24 family metallopeptidase [Acidobacteriota bacterium]|nr:M24 family metallopeptidase [Acidobacteriota bacterium]